MEERQHHLNESSSARLRRSQELEILPSPNSKSLGAYFLGAYCSARDWERSGLLEENPQSGCTEIRASLKGPLEVYSQPMLPGETQV